MTIAAAVAAWLGGSLVLLSDGRRGLALGIAILGAGLAGLAVDIGQFAEAVALLAGAAGAAALRLRDGRDDWGVMPPGSTPRLILAVVSGLVALYLATVVTEGGAIGFRFAVPAAITVLILRLLLGADRAAAAAAASGIALALGAGALLSPNGATEAACIAAAIVAIGLQAIPHSEPDGA